MISVLERFYNGQNEYGINCKISHGIETDRVFVIAQSFTRLAFKKTKKIGAFGSISTSKLSESRNDTIFLCLFSTSTVLHPTVAFAFKSKSLVLL